MLKLICVLIAITSIYSCEKQLEPGTYRINGRVNDLNEQGEIYLMKFPVIDTIKVTNGEFQLEKKILEPVQVVYLSKEANGNMNPKTGVLLYLEPSVMELSLDYTNFSNSRLTGSRTQENQYKLDEIKDKIAEDFITERERFFAVGKEYDSVVKAGDSKDKLEKIKYKYNDAREGLAPMWQKQKAATLDFIKKNPKTYLGVELLGSLLSDMTYDEAKTIVSQFNPEYLKTESGARLLKEMENMKKGIPGAIAGNFDTIDINGKPIKLSDFRGKYLLIDFWASWCVPCRKGNPHLIELYKKYNSKGFEIVGVSDDDRDHDAWRKAVEKDQIGIWHHVLRGLKIKDGRIDFNDKSTDISDGYNIESLPTKILMNPDGVIIGRYGSGRGTDTDLDMDLANLFEK